MASPVDTLMARVTALTVALTAHECNIMHQGLLEGGAMAMAMAETPHETDAVLEAVLTANPDIARVRVRTIRSRRILLLHLRAVLLGVDPDADQLAAVAAGAFDDQKEW